MRKTVSFSLKNYANISGDRKVRIGLSLSNLVRLVRKTGSIATGDNSWKQTKADFLR